MLFALLVVAIGTATFKESFQERGMNRLGRNAEGAQQMSLALAQGQSGKVFKLILTHYMSKISRSGIDASKNENAPEQENAAPMSKPLEARRSELSVNQLSEIAAGGNVGARLNHDWDVGRAGDIEPEAVLPHPKARIASLGLRVPEHDRATVVGG